MYKSILFITTLILLSCKTTTYYIVRHAEKEATNTMTGDVPLSEAGMQRAQALKDALENKNIKYIFSTNFVRTKSTVQPLSQAIGVPIEVYDPSDPNFISRLRNIHGNTLIVGHSNTVDDVVNALSEKKEINGDLPDAAYGDLFIVKKKGNHYSFEKKHFGR